jgi:tRNA threonylcarbamoyladenosine biosynthesis protein TsaE
MSKENVRLPAEGVTARTSSPDETEALGARLAAELRPGDVVLVSGDLGAGKTTLIRGAARALGVREPALLDDYVTPEAVSFIEWPRAAEPWLERITRRVELRHAGGDEREIDF